MKETLDESLLKFVYLTPRQTKNHLVQEYVDKDVDEQILRLLFLHVHQKFQNMLTISDFLYQTDSIVVKQSHTYPLKNKDFHLK